MGKQLIAFPPDGVVGGGLGCEFLFQPVREFPECGPCLWDFLRVPADAQSLQHRAVFGQVNTLCDHFVDLADRRDVSLGCCESKGFLVPL